MGKRHRRKKVQAARKSHTQKTIHVEPIEQEIRKLLAQYHYPVLVSDMKELQTWGLTTAFRLQLPYNSFTAKVTELFWAAINVQLSIGYALIAYETCSYPKGIEGVAYHPDDIPNMTMLPEIHYWYHIHNARECIYRCWERMTMVLRTACYSESVEKFYFNQLTAELRKDERFKDNTQLSQLKKYEKHWSKVADIRNTLTHGRSSPIKEGLQGEITELYDSKDDNVMRYIYSAPNLAQELNNVKDSYMRIFPVWKSIMRFIDNIEGNSGGSGG